MRVGIFPVITSHLVSVLTVRGCGDLRYSCNTKKILCSWRVFSFPFSPSFVAPGICLLGFGMNINPVLAGGMPHSRPGSCCGSSCCSVQRLLRARGPCCDRGRVSADVLGGWGRKETSLQPLRSCGHKVKSC